MKEKIIRQTKVKITKHLDDYTTDDGRRAYKIMAQGKPGQPDFMISFWNDNKIKSFKVGEEVEVYVTRDFSKKGDPYYKGSFDKPKENKGFNRQKQGLPNDQLIRLEALKLAVQNTEENSYIENQDNINLIINTAFFFEQYIKNGK